MKIHRLTVDGQDYFLPDPIDELRAEILKAIRAGGGYVNIPPLRGGPGIDILFSPGHAGDLVADRCRRRPRRFDAGETDDSYEDPYEVL